MSLAAGHISLATRIAYAMLCLLATGVGLTLVVLPWKDSWSFNYLQQLTPFLEYVWDEPFFRGAISGLGLANLLIACQAGLLALSRSGK